MDSDVFDVLLIDDEVLVKDLVEESLSGICRVKYAKSGSEALDILADMTVRLVLVDVEMPGIDGYETCRRIKQMENQSGVPVIFLSGHTDIEDRLKGYEAGGDDYVAKPFNLLELKAKVVQLLASIASRADLKSMVDYASNAAMTAMTSMSELGSLLEVLKNLNACNDAEGLAMGVVDGFSQFGLHSVVRVLVSDRAVLKTDHGAATPLEVSVTAQMANMERIVHFKSRMSISYEHVAVLVSNMPFEDDERCGRLRDHLAMLVEAADVRATSIVVMQQAQARGKAIEHAVERISEALYKVDSAQRNGRVNERLAVDQMLSELEKALLTVALTDAQEEYVADVIRKGANNIIRAQTEELGIQNGLTDIVKELKLVLAKH